MRNYSKASLCPKQKRNVTALTALNSMKMSWYSACLLLLFLFRTNGKKGRLDENDVRHCHCIFFESGISKVTWSQLCSKFLSNIYETHWKQHFGRIPYSQVISGHGSTNAQHLSSRLRWTWKKKKKSKIVPRKRSAAQKSKCALRKTLNLSRTRFTYFIRFFFSQT